MASKHEMKVLFDSDVATHVDMAALIAVCAEAIDADGAGRLVAPPRHAVDFDGGRLVFTTGGLDDVVGFRAYDTFPNSRQDQVVAVWNRSTATLSGLVVGDQLGAVRTGAIGGVAVDRLARTDAVTCAVIGTGRQARTQLTACCVVRQIERVSVFSRSASKRQQFADEMSERLGVEVRPASTAKSAVSDADIVLVATNARQPVVDDRDIRDDAHVNTIGPKSADAHEISPQLAEGASCVTSDAPQQIAAQGSDHFLAGSSSLKRLRHLGDLDRGVGRQGRTLFLSAGLAGTEVLVADALIRAASIA